MAMTVTSSLQFHGSLLPYTHFPGALVGICNSTASTASTSRKSQRPLSSDLFCISDRSRKSGVVVVVRSESRRRITASATIDHRGDLGGNAEGIISGEWPDNFSLLSYEDLRAYLEPQIIKEKMRPSALLGEVMSTPIRAATADQTLEEINHHFEVVSGLPVIDDQLRCIGVVSKTDCDRATNGLKSKVGEVMSSPAITLSPKKTVLDAAALMLKMKIHRIPILNEEGQVVGIVARTDVFQALEAVEV